MKKRFHAKKRNNKFKLLLILIIIFSIYKFTEYYKNQDKDFYNKLINIGSNNIIDISNIFDFIDNVNLTNSTFLTKYASNGYVTIDDTVKVNIDKSITNNDPIVYLYNTHQKEAYQMINNMEHNIVPTVYLASYILSTELNNMGINTIVEDNDVTEILRTNSWQYKYSYKASRILMDDIKKNNPSLKYYIDIHRDSSKYEKTITTINDIKVARILFVVGMEHDNYQSNLELTTILNNRIVEKYPSISRGIYKKSGEGVNGVYNQDFHPNTILIEVGGQYNNIEEVNNSLKLIAPIIGDYIKEDLYGKEDN